VLHSIDGHLTTGKVVCVSCSSCVAVVLQSYCSCVAVILHLLLMQACKHMAYLITQLLRLACKQRGSLLHIKDPPSKIQIGSQQAVAGGGTSKSSGGTYKAIDAVKLYMLSYPPVSHKCSNSWLRHHTFDHHTPDFHTAAISRFPIFSIEIFIVFGLFLFIFFKLIFFHSGQMAKFLHGQSKLQYIVSLHILQDSSLC